MKEVIAEIRSLRTDMDGKFTSLDIRLQILYGVIGVIAIPTLLIVIANFITK